MKYSVLQSMKSANKGFVYAAIMCFSLCVLAVIMIASYNIHLFSKGSSNVAGRLERVYMQSNALKLCIEGNDYLICKSNHSEGTYGIIYGLKLGDVDRLLKKMIGLECNLEYVETAFEHKRIVKLEVDEVNIVDKEGAVQDYIEEQNEARIWGTIFLVFTLVCYLLVKMGVIK